MRWAGAALAVLLAAGCGGGEPVTADGLARSLADAGLPNDSPAVLLDVFRAVCDAPRDGMIDAAQAVAANDVAERTYEVGINYVCPDRSDEFRGIVERYREMVGGQPANSVE